MAKSTGSIIAGMAITMGLIILFFAFLGMSLGASSDMWIGLLVGGGIFIASGIYVMQRRTLAKVQQPVSQPLQPQSDAYFDQILEEQQPEYRLQESPNNYSKASKVAFKEIKRREKVF